MGKVKSKILEFKDWTFIDNQRYMKNEEVGKHKMGFYKKSKFLQFCVMVPILAFFSYIVLNLRHFAFADYSGFVGYSESVSISLLFSYSAFFMIFISVMTLCVSYTYKIFFSRHFKRIH